MCASLSALAYAFGMSPYLAGTPQRGSDDLHSGQIHDSSEREAVIDAQHLFAPASSEARIQSLKLALSVRLGLIAPLGVQRA